MLTEKFQSVDDMDQKDIRRMFPRYQQGNFEINIKLVKEIETLAMKKGCTPAQLALGWLVTLSKREDMPEIIPIPGASKCTQLPFPLHLHQPLDKPLLHVNKWSLMITPAASAQHVKENATVFELGEHEMEEIDSIISMFPVAGERYHPMGMKLTNM